MNVNYALPQWNYYRMLEGDLEHSFRFIQPDKANYQVYSDHFAMIILSAASEIENALRAIAKATGDKKKKHSIRTYYTCVNSKYSLFCNTEVVMPRFNGKFKPWDGWNENSSPDWWTNGYNKIKHNRLDYKNAPTLERALNTVAALQVVLLHYYRILSPGVMMPAELEPKLLMLSQIEGDFRDADVLWSWVLPNEISN